MSKPSNLYGLWRCETCGGRVVPACSDCIFCYEWEQTPDGENYPDTRMCHNCCERLETCEKAGAVKSEVKELGLDKPLDELVEEMRELRDAVSDESESSRRYDSWASAVAAIVRRSIEFETTAMRFLFLDRMREGPLFYKAKTIAHDILAQITDVLRNRPEVEAELTGLGLYSQGVLILTKLFVFAVRWAARKETEFIEGLLVLTQFGRGRNILGNCGVLLREVRMPWPHEW